MARTVQVEELVNDNIKRIKTVDLDASAPISSVGVVPVSLGATAVASEAGDALIHQTTITLTDLAQAVANGTEYQGTKIYDFPAGRILVLGVVASIAQKTTSAIDTTLNAEVTGALAIGTATASNVTLDGAMADLLPSTAFTSSATINVAGAAVGAALAASAQFDGTSTAKDVFINTSYATTTDVDGNATQTLTGTVTITWLNLGDI
jgi:energy-converting hydrogenase Eha subunit F